MFEPVQSLELLGSMAAPVLLRMTKQLSSDFSRLHCLLPVTSGPVGEPLLYKIRALHHLARGRELELLATGHSLDHARHVANSPLAQGICAVTAVVQDQVPYDPA